MLKSKKGISLILLVIMAVAVIALLSIGIVSLDKNIELSSISAFSNDLKDIEDTASAYIIENGNEALQSMTKDEVINMVSGSNREQFINELRINLDQDETTFYLIDLEKIGVVKSTKGFSENGVDDVYVLASNSLHAYYLKGISLDGIVYFSINDKIRDMVNEVQDDNRFWILKDGIEYGPWGSQVTDLSISGNIIKEQDYIQMENTSGYMVYAYERDIDLSEYRYCYVQLDKSTWNLDQIFFLNTYPFASEDASQIAIKFTDSELINTDENGIVTYKLDISSLDIIGYFAFASLDGSNNQLKMYNVYFE